MWATMDKGERTQQEILAHAAVIFAKQGYSGASMSELTRATGLSKGAIYNHFDNKDDLAIKAFDYSMQLVTERFAKYVADKRTTRSRLGAMIDMFLSLVEDPLLPSGCPIQATSIESDDTHPTLRQHARDAMDKWKAFIIRTVQKGKELGDVKPDVDEQYVADVMTTTLEGGVMLSKLYGNSQAIKHSAEHMVKFVDSLLIAE